MNYILDNNVIIDLLSERRQKQYPESLTVYNKLKETDNALYISASSVDNIEFILFKELKAQFDYENREALAEVHKRLKEFLKSILIAPTPSYIELDYEDIEDSQIIASAQAIDAKVLTRDEQMLQKHPNITIHPKDYLSLALQTVTEIDFANLKKQYFMYLPELQKEMDKVLNNAAYIMGDAVRELEENLQKFTGAKHAITCSSGTDALLLAMMALDIGPGDEVITTPFTFIATAETIALLGAIPVFVDIDEQTYNIDPAKIEAAITDKTKAIIPVSLYGQPTDMDAIQAVVDKVEGGRWKVEENSETNPSSFPLHPSPSKIKIIIDGAQSFGSTYKGKTDSNLGDISTTSFFPAKPLGCFGDGGAVFTNDDALATKMKQLRVHGQNKRYHHKYIGLGGRMDTLQCGIVNVKLKYYAEDLKRRQEVAKKYSVSLGDLCEGKSIITPTLTPHTTSAWAQYSIRITPSTFNLPPSSSSRDELQAKLKDAGIPTAVHYPMPLHLQECFAYLGYKQGDFPLAEKISEEIMSLPMNPYLSDEEISYITNKVIECID